MAESKTQTPLDPGLSKESTKGKHGGKRPHRINDPLLRPPPRRLYNDKASKFFGWWKEVHAKDTDRLTGYVYRDFPKENRPERELCVLHLTEPPNDEMDFYANPELGCGDYRVYLNDSREKGKTWSQLVLKGYRNYRDYPPFVSLDYLDWEDSNNRPYITAMQSLGRLPGREDYNMQVRDAESASALTHLSALVEKQFDMQIKQAERQQDQGQKTPSIEGRIAAGYVDTLMSALNQGAQIMTQAASEAKNIGAPQSATGQLKEMAEVLALLQPQQPAAAGVDQMKFFEMIQNERTAHAAEISKLRDDQLGTLRDELKALREKPAPKQEDSLEHFLTLRGKLAEAGLLGEGETQPDKISRWLALASTLAPALSQFGTALLGAAFNYAAARNPGRAPIPPPSPEEIRRQQLEAASPEQRQQAMALQFLDSVKAALIHHFSQPHLDGGTFAQWLIESRTDGLVIYRGVCEVENAKELLGQLMQAHQEIWQHLGQNPKTLNMFLDEFLQYNEEPDEKNTEGEPAGVAN